MKNCTLLVWSWTIPLYELCRAVEELTGKHATPPTICKTLKRYGFSRKKIRQVALQRCCSLRGAFMAQVMLLQCKVFVWVDESGCGKKDSIRKYGYALHGVHAEYHQETQNLIPLLQCLLQD